MFVIASTFILIIAAAITLFAVWMTLQDYGEKALSVLSGDFLIRPEPEFRVRQIRQPRVYAAKQQGAAGQRAARYAA